MALGRRPSLHFVRPPPVVAAPKATSHALYCAQREPDDEPPLLEGLAGQLVAILDPAGLA